MCVCSIGVCGLFGELVCFIGLWECLLCVGGCKWRVGVAMYKFCGLGKVYTWGWDMLVARRCSFSSFPCIGRIGILRFVHRICLRLFRSGLRAFD